MLSKLLKILNVAFFTVIGLYTFVWLSSPWIANHYLGQYLETEGLVLNDETSIRYNPFRSRLEVNTLSINKSDSGRALSLSYLSFELNLHQLIFEDIYIPKIVIKGLDLSIEKSESEIFVAGISLGLGGKEGRIKTSEDIEDSERDSDDNSEPNFLKRFLMPKLILEDSSINLNLGGNKHRLSLQSIEVIDVLATLQKQVINLSIKSALDDGPIEINVNADLLDKKGTVDFDVEISNIEIGRFSHLLTKDIDTLKGLVSYQGRHRLKIQDDSIELSIEKGRLSGAEINIGKEDTYLSIGQQKLSLDGFVVILDDNQPPRIKGEGSTKINDLVIYNDKKFNKLVDIKQLDFSSITLFSDEKGIQRVSVGSVALNETLLSDNQDDSIPALVKFSSLNIQEIGLSQEGIEIGDVSLAGLIANVELDENKEVKNLIDIPTKKEALEVDKQETELTSNTSEIVDSNTAESKSNFKIKLKSFKLVNDAEIFFLDHSVEPIYKQNVVINNMMAGPFDSENSEQESIITLSGKSNRYATFSFTTIAKPFLAKPSYKLEGDFKEFSLPSLSSYIKQALQYEIESGQLDLRVDVQLTGADIEGEVQVLLRGIDLTAADDSEKSSLIDQKSVPFNMALGMLKDSNGNVELTLPISGDTSSPDFGLSGFLTLLVKQATLLGARDYLVNTFVPYAQVVNIAIIAGTYALKVRINDLPYTEKVTELQPEQQEFLQQFSALLKDQESTQVKLCAIATAADINKQSGSDLTNSEDLKRLKEISKQRVDIFKAYMTEKENIHSSRLLLCTPQIDSSDDAVSRLSFET